MREEKIEKRERGEKRERREKEKKRRKRARIRTSWEVATVGKLVELVEGYAVIPRNLNSQHFQFFY